jgi:Mg2+ and Co2+ transporter CorA
MDELDGKNTTELELKKQFLIRQTAKERAKAIEARIKEMLISGDIDKEELKKLGEQRKEQLNIIQQTKDDAAYIRKKDAKEREEDEKKTSEASVKNAQDEAKRRADAYKKYRDDRIAVEREIQDLIIAGIRDDESREKAEREARFNRQLEDIKKNEKYTADERLKLTNLLTLNYNAQVAAEEDARRQEELQKKKEFEDEKLRLEKEADMASLDAAATNADAQYAIVEGLAQKEVERVRMTTDEKIKATQDGLGALINLTQAFAGKTVAEQKKAFKITKAANIANATIDTYKAATTALASAPNPIAGAIFAAIAVANGIANIKKIASTQFEGGGNAAPTSTASSATATPTAMQPTFNFQGSGNNANSLNSQNDLSMITVKAVVSESEVTSTQNQVSKYENSAKL